jgi:hypothetical protein
VKISELLQEESLPDYLTRLVKKAGVKKLGGGAYSQVFQHPKYGNVVVKVYTAKDRDYARYVQFCLKHQSNPYVPRIADEVKYKSPEGEKYNIVFLEKMTAMKTARGVAAKLQKAFSKLEPEELSDIEYHCEEQDMPELFEYLDALVKEGRANSSFVELWKHIRSYGKDKFDMHPGNVMLRGQQLVITDPVAADPTSRVDEL